jgi:hypothetical protein
VPRITVSAQKLFQPRMNTLRACNILFTPSRLALSFVSNCFLFVPSIQFASMSLPVHSICLHVPLLSVFPSRLCFLVPSSSGDCLRHQDGRRCVARQGRHHASRSARVWHGRRYVLCDCDSETARLTVRVCLCLCVCVYVCVRVCVRVCVCVCVFTSVFLLHSNGDQNAVES